MKALLALVVGVALTGCSLTREWDGERAMGELFSHYDYAKQDYVFKSTVDMDCIDYYNQYYAAGAVGLDHKALKDHTNRYLILMADQCKKNPGMYASGEPMAPTQRVEVTVRQAPQPFYQRHNNRQNIIILDNQRGVTTTW